MSDRKPWQQLPGETSKAYAAFEKYRDLPKEKRTIVEAARLTYGPKGVTGRGNAVGRIRDWMNRFDWEARAQAFDEHLLGVEVERREEKARQLGDDLADEAALIRRVLLEPSRLLAQDLAGDDASFREEWEKIPLEQRMRLADRAGRGHAFVGRFERLNRGLGEGRVELTGPDGGPLEMTLELAIKMLAPVLGVDEERVVDELAEKRRQQRARERQERRETG